MTYDDLRNAQYEHNDPRYQKDIVEQCECCKQDFDPDDLYCTGIDRVCEECYDRLLEIDE